MSTQTSTDRKFRILIVDDDDLLRRWLLENLERRGFEVQEECQGDEALAAYCGSGPWDFVLSDLYFYPGEQIRNGLDLIHQILLLNPPQRAAIHTSESKVNAPCAVLHKPYTIGALLKLFRAPLRSLELKGMMNR